MALFIGVGNYTYSRKNKSTLDLSNDYYNIITENGSNLLTETYRLILRDLNNISSELGEILLTENNTIINIE